jgi:aspartate aminotransferase-like enzyme
VPGLLPDIDPDGLQEFSVVFTDRSLNHMSKKYQAAMRDISATLKDVYKASAVALVPGGGTYAMEAVARQFANGKHALIVRNGWFSFRWTQIFDMGGFAAKTTVVNARQTGNAARSPYAPPPIATLPRRSARKSRMWFSLRMWKPRPV